LRIKVHHKFVSVFILISAAILLGVFFYLSTSLREHTFNRIREGVARQLALSRSYLKDAPFKDVSSYDVDTIADTIGDDLGLRATIIGLDGTVYGDSELEGEALRRVENHLMRPEVQQALRSGTGESRRFSTTRVPAQERAGGSARPSKKTSFIRPLCSVTGTARASSVSPSRFPTSNIWRTA
jgi:two-component system phosphate regulon sensor histidine kinase PhoR